MSKEIEQVAGSFRTFEQMYDDVITKGVNSILFLFDNQDEKWKRMELFWMLDYFIEKEEYEKCAKLQKLIDELENCEQSDGRSRIVPN